MGVGVEGVGGWALGVGAESCHEGWGRGRGVLGCPSLRLASDRYPRGLRCRRSRRLNVTKACFLSCVSLSAA